MFEYLTELGKSLDKYLLRCIIVLIKEVMQCPRSQLKTLKE